MLGQYKDNEIVKSLLEAGLDEEYILDGIEKGEIKIEKSEKPEPEDKAKEVAPEADVDGEGDGDEDDLEEMEKACEIKKAEYLELEEKIAAKKAKKSKKPEDKVEKSEGNDLGGGFDTDAFEKSLADKLEKSFSAIMESRFGKLQEELDLLKSENESLRADLEEVSNNSVGFKAPDNLSFIEKGLESREIKDSSGKQMLHIIKQREAVKDVLLKAYEEADSGSEIKKSIADELSAYASDTEAQSIDEKVAKYLFDKHSVRLLK